MQQPTGVPRYYLVPSLQYHKYHLSCTGLLYTIATYDIYFHGMYMVPGPRGYTR